MFWDGCESQLNFLVLSVMHLADFRNHIVQFVYVYYMKIWRQQILTVGSGVPSGYARYPVNTMDIIKILFEKVYSLEA